MLIFNRYVSIPGLDVLYSSHTTSADSTPQCLTVRKDDDNNVNLVERTKITYPIS